jgi:hypothetical protein
MYLGNIHSSVQQPINKLLSISHNKSCADQELNVAVIIYQSGCGCGSVAAQQTITTEVEAPLLLLYLLPPAGCCAISTRLLFVRVVHEYPACCCRWANNIMHVTRGSWLD